MGNSNVWGTPMFTYPYGARWRQDLRLGQLLFEVRLVLLALRLAPSLLQPQLLGLSFET